MWYKLGLLLLFVVRAKCELEDDHPMRGSKCEIPEHIDEASKPIFLKKCLEAHYGNEMTRSGKNETCYPELGCFPTGGPWPDLFPPLHPAEINTKLYCFTREDRNKTVIRIWPTVALRKCRFSPARKTVFITHGFASNGQDGWLSNIKNSYLNWVDANVFIVDWGKGAQLLNYLQVVGNTRIVGAEVGRVLEHFIQHLGVAPKNVHLIGHSLGAHISAYVAKRNNGPKGLIGRITALDPAQPGFEGENVVTRLNQSDAAFIDVIHTNALPFGESLGFGYMEPLGHVDFYMNGGRFQPGCVVPSGLPPFSGLKDLIDLPVEAVKYWVTCSHSRSHEYFEQVLNSDCKIWGRKAEFPLNVLGSKDFELTKDIESLLGSCSNDTCLPIGLDTPNYPARGVFSAVTQFLSPFCNDRSESDKIIKEMNGGNFSSSSDNSAGKNSGSCGHWYWPWC